MPEGQYLGAKATYIYVSDDNATYEMSRDMTLAQIAGTGLVLATDVNSIGADNLPRNFKPRGVYWESTGQSLVRKKFIICGTRDSELYTASGSTNFQIDGIAGRTTGRTGESKSFKKRTAPTPPA